MQYLFGDTDLAAQRLKLLADTFGKSTGAFLLDSAGPRPELAVDLGCGPGHTTGLLAEVLGPSHTVGLDRSEDYIAAARESQGSNISFHRHDITEVPFPVGPCDLIFCRFVLTHLADPRSDIERWVTQLRPDGRLLVEETESITTASPVLSTYLGIIDAMLRHQGNMLYIGPILDRLPAATVSRVQPVSVPAHVAARMFYMNLLTWRSNQFVGDNYPSSAIDRLEHDLQALSENLDAPDEIEWGMRQIVFS